MSAPDRTLPVLTKARHWIVNGLLVGLIKLALALPYTARVRFMGFIVENVVGPIAGYRQAAIENIQKIWPNMPEPETRRIARASLNNAGRTFIENYSAKEFPKRQAMAEITGPGWAALQSAAAKDRPAILVPGHYGNYEAVRAALVARGLSIGGLYRDMSNPFFNAHYVKTMEAFGGPVFPQGRRGTAGFVRHLRSGGQLVLLFDQHVFKAPVLHFLGQPAHTAVSAAELAMRYDAELIPFYGIRRNDGLSFDIVLETPVEHTEPNTMTQALNDSLSARIEADPGQWFWVPRRWRAKAR